MIGEVSKPINNVDQIILIKLLNKRKIETNLNLEVTKLKNLIKQRKNELLNLYSNNHLSKKK